MVTNATPNIVLFLRSERRGNGRNRTYIDSRSRCTHGRLLRRVATGQQIHQQGKFQPSSMLRSSLKHKLYSGFGDSCVYGSYNSPGATGGPQCQSQEFGASTSVRKSAPECRNTRTSGARPGVCIMKVSLHQKGEREGSWLACVPGQRLSSFRMVSNVTSSAGLTHPISSKYVEKQPTRAAKCTFGVELYRIYTD